MLTCNVSNVSSILFNHTSSHDSHTEVHQPASISNSTTSHHTSPGHHLYEGDLVSKTSNLNEFSISSNWGLGLGFSGGGRKKDCLSLPIPRAFFFFLAPPPSPLEVAQVLEIVEIMDFIIANSTTISYIPLVCLKTQLSVPASTCIYCRLYVVRVDTYIVWFQWWSVEECLDLMA